MAEAIFGRGSTKPLNILPKKKPKLKKKIINKFVYFLFGTPIFFYATSPKDRRTAKFKSLIHNLAHGDINQLPEEQEGPLLGPTNLMSPVAHLSLS